MRKLVFVLALVLGAGTACADGDVINGEEPTGGVEITRPTTTTQTTGCAGTWVKSYTRKDGTVVSGYCRQR